MLPPSGKNLSRHHCFKEESAQVCYQIFVLPQLSTYLIRYFRMPYGQWGEGFGVEGRGVAVLISSIRTLETFPYSNQDFFLNTKDALYLYNVIYQLYLNKAEKKGKWPKRSSQLSLMIYTTCALKRQGRPLNLLLCPFGIYP